MGFVPIFCMRRPIKETELSVLTEQQFKACLAPALIEMGYEFVGLQFFTEGRQRGVRIFIDCEGGVNSEDCAKAIRQVRAILAVEDPDGAEQYSLELSSPGLDRLLFSIEDFKRFIGRQVRVRLHQPVGDRRKLIATVESVNEQDEVVFKEADGQLMSISYASIAKARLVPLIDEVKS
jgi:ribosome maturation factor RimP